MRERKSIPNIARSVKPRILSATNSIEIKVVAVTMQNKWILGFLGGNIMLLRLAYCVTIIVMVWRFKLLLHWLIQLKHVKTQTQCVHHAIGHVNNLVTSCLCCSSLTELFEPPFVKKHAHCPGWSWNWLDPGRVETSLSVGSTPRLVLEERCQEGQCVVP